MSGTGDWRYVDVTSFRAGKLAALEYVRTLFGVHHSRCVAAGDSGNDTLMLGGRNLAIGGWVVGRWDEWRRGMDGVGWMEGSDGESLGTSKAAAGSR